MRVLLTGARGQVGSALSASPPPAAEVFALGHEELDITDEEAARVVISRLAPDVIVNAAAYTAVDCAESEPDAAYRVNALGPRVLAKIALERSARLIHVSTDFVFDGDSSVPYPPDAPTNPLNVYGRSKLEGEIAALELLGEGATVIRTAWVYHSSGHNFVRTMLRLMSSQRTVRVVSDQIGTPTAARSLARAIWHAAGSSDLNGIHHWTDSGVSTWYDFAVAIAEEGLVLRLLPQGVTVVPIPSAEYPTPARRPRFSVLDTRSLTRRGLAPVHWRENLREVLKELACA